MAAGRGDDLVSVKFVVNGKEVEVQKPHPRKMLGDFLRDEMRLKGLQMPCRQGGCGACTVILATPQGDHRPVNSCLSPLCSMDGMSVTTIEGVGSIKRGLSPVQKALVTHHATQCGFCTPGMVMSMCGLLRKNPNPSSQEVEDQIDGNLCRCTGYRPLLDAFQTFACEADKKGSSCLELELDMEDICNKGIPRNSVKRLLLSKGGITWIRVLSLQDLYSVLTAYRNQGTVRMVRGNTSTGVYPEYFCDVLIDISQIPALIKADVNNKGISIGGGVSISDFMILLNAHRGLSCSYGPMWQHLARVASPQVRNIGSVAGNLMMAHEHPDFVSDVATILMAAETKIKLCSAYSNGLPEFVNLEQFFGMDMDGKVITEIHIPALPANSHFFRQKVALRRVNAHPIMNAAFKFEVDPQTGQILSSPIIVYGGVKPFPQRARQLEKKLIGKSYQDPKVLKECLMLLQTELVADPSFGRSKYRSLLVNAFFYKAILSLWPINSLPPRLHSAVKKEIRPISSGSVSFDEGDPSEYPVSQALPKLSAQAQVTGEAEFLDDLKLGDGLHAVFVLSTVANATIKAIDPSKALSMKGVVAFISANTIAIDGYCNAVSDYELVFASKRVHYYGQAVGMVVAKTKSIADAAAKLVQVNYTNVMKPILTIEDAIKANSFFDSRAFDFQKGNVDASFSSDEAIVEGEVSTGHQYHFHLETQRSLCIPGEEGCMTVYSSTQNPSQVQQCVAVALNRPQHKINVNVKRVGGAYGAKLNRSPPVAMACAMAADKLQRPVRLLLDLSTNMQLFGGRSPYLCKYKVAAQKNGQITAIQMKVFNNQGAHFDFDYPDLTSIPTFIDGAYNIANWKIEGKIAKTNLPACTYMRGPVFVETAAMIETMMEHIAQALGLQPDVVREINMYTKGDMMLCGQELIYCNAKLVFDTVKASSNYQNRAKDVKIFNDQNRWVKRGLSLVPVKFNAYWEAQQMICLVNIHPDFSISIYHSGCEIGQGLDVKVAQVAAMSMGSLIDGHLDMDEIYVHSTTTIVANNVAGSGGSVTSELCAKAVQDACQQLVSRLECISKILSSTKGKPTWQQLILKALDIGIDLQARGRIYPGPGPTGPFQYVSFGAGVTEVEVDMLTGETHILRADVLLDCGKSLNPAVDIGQVQGAFVQGLGYHLSEQYIHNEQTGKLITDGTWEYKPPSSKDIPLNFNAALLPNSSNPYGVLRSKFSGEPPYAIACSAFFAVRQAIAAGKSEWGNNQWLSLRSPATVEEVAVAAAVPLSKLNILNI